MSIIDIINLRKSYRSKPNAVVDFSLTIPNPVIFGLVGPNGAGKSTIFNILSGLVKKDEGDIYILGNRISSNDVEYKRKIGFVLEQPHYLEKLTVKEYLHFVGTLYQIDKYEIVQRSNELMDVFDLREKEHQWIDTYSKGMKKKVSLAAALIHKPELLILDEPFDGIDPTSVKIIKTNLHYMVENGVTVFISSHNLDTLERICDHVAIMDKGRLVFESKMSDIKHRIKNELSFEKYQSLEEIFVDMVSGETENSTRKLSWL